MLPTREAVRLLEWNLGRRKCRHDFALFASRVEPSGIELVLGLPHPERLTKIMHRVRTIATTEFNGQRGVVGTQRWRRGFEVEELSHTQVAAAARRVGRSRRSRVQLDPLPGPRAKGGGKRPTR